MPILFPSNNETGHIKWDQGDVSFIHSLGTSRVHDHLVHIHHTFPYFNSWKYSFIVLLLIDSQGLDRTVF